MEKKYRSALLLVFGVFLPLLILFRQSIVRLEHWGLIYPAAAALSISGYYAGLRDKGYQPLRTIRFYGRVLLAIIPVLGATALARDLYFAPRQGEPVMPRGRTATSIWAVALLLSMIGGCLTTVNVPAIVANQKNMQITSYIDRARLSLQEAEQRAAENKDVTELLGRTHSALTAAREQAAQYEIKSYDGELDLLSGDVHRLANEFDAAEKSYLAAGNKSIPEEIIKGRLSKMHRAGDHGIFPASSTAGP